MKTLNIIGCGQLGRALGKLWHGANLFKIQDVLNRSNHSASEAVSFMGTGRAVENIMDLRRSDLIMIATSDSSIEAYANSLSKLDLINEGSVVFHCSGALSSLEFVALKQMGALVCSAHPVKSFAGVDAYKSFPGTHVALEGDVLAVEILSRAFVEIGGIPFVIPSEAKILYHGALTIVSNYIPALLEVGLGILGQSGMNSAQALSLIEPLVRGTIDNVFSLGTVDALTGPISRGDKNVVRAHLEALSGDHGKQGELTISLYKLLGNITLELARRQDKVDKCLLDEVGDIFI